MSLIDLIGIERYEASKTALRDRLPISRSHMRLLKRPLSHLHQLYFEDYVFIHINKCGGTSIERALGIPLLNHDTMEERAQRIGSKRVGKRFKFAFVRHPLHRLRSAFFFAHSGSEELALADPGVQRLRFQEWAKPRVLNAATGHRNFMPQTAWVRFNGKVDLDFVGRFESLVDDFEQVRRILGIRRALPALKRRDIKLQKPIEWWYEGELGPMALSAYDEDFERFGYDRV